MNKFFANLFSALMGGLLTLIVQGLWRHNEDLIVACSALFIIATAVRFAFIAVEKE